MSDAPQITAGMVWQLHELLLSSEPGLRGDLGEAKLEGVLARVELTMLYDEIDDIFDIAALYAVAIAQGHAFNDANKRTGLVTALTYLELQGVTIPRTPELEDIMVDVATRKLSYSDLALLLYALAQAASLNDSV